MKKTKVRNRTNTETRFKLEMEEIKRTGVIVNLMSVYKKKERYIFRETRLNMREFITMSLFLMATVVWMKDETSEEETDFMYQCPVIIHNKKGGLLLSDNIQKQK